MGWLAGLFAALLWLGGSSWPDVPGLAALRCAAMLLVGVSLTATKARDSRDCRAVWWLFAGIALLTALHLVALPHAWWERLPGRELVVRIDQAANLGAPLRPLSMSPPATLNALLALTIPLAVLALASKLSARDQLRSVTLLAALALVSAAMGVAQASGLAAKHFVLASELGRLFANRDHQAVFLCTLFPLAGAIASQGSGFAVPRVLEKSAAIFMAALAVPLILITGSRAGLAIAVPAIAGTLLAMRPAVDPNRSRGAARAVLAGVVFLGIAGIALFTIVDARAIAIERMKAGASDDLRWLIWRTVMGELPQYMPWGSGIGSFARVYASAEPVLSTTPRFINHAHCEWMEIAYTAGVPGLVLVAIALGLWGRAFYACLRGPGGSDPLRWLGVVIIALLGLASSVDYPVRTPLLSGLLALAAVWASPPQRSARRGSNSEHLPC